ncbi:MAG: ABC transporter permease subunit [Oscillospiraceae bacterium]|jgi:putative aldouronate transport system permease protein|nr:ABC transporter permease subunit [Oscillospiraceae bacterium]
MAAPGMLWLFLFSIVPMAGIIIAFQDYVPKSSLFQAIASSPFVGLENFEYLFSMRESRRVITNTLIIAGAKIALNLLIPLMFALLLNEVRSRRYKRIVQTVVYLPHFLSWVILASIILSIFGYDGVVNKFTGIFGKEPVVWMGEPGIFRQLVVGTDVWKEFGYNAVIFLAALTGINPTLYEAASIDGANRIQLVWHVTLPGLLTTIVLLLVLSLGNVLNAGFDQVFNMYNPMVYSTGDILDTWVYRIGLTKLQFSLGTTAGLFKSAISFVLISISYLLAYRFADYTIF